MVFTFDFDLILFQMWSWRLTDTSCVSLPVTSDILCHNYPKRPNNTKTNKAQGSPELWTWKRPVWVQNMKMKIGSTFCSFIPITCGLLPISLNYLNARNTHKQVWLLPTMSNLSLSKNWLDTTNFELKSANYFRCIPVNNLRYWGHS